MMSESANKWLRFGLKILCVKVSTHCGKFISEKKVFSKIIVKRNPTRISEYGMSDFCLDWSDNKSYFSILTVCHHL